MISQDDLRLTLSILHNGAYPTHATANHWGNVYREAAAHGEDLTSWPLYQLVIETDRERDVLHFHARDDEAARDYVTGRFALPDISNGEVVLHRIQHTYDNVPLFP